jgi:DNA-binding MarR family transcriptional regulator
VCKPLDSAEACRLAQPTALDDLLLYRLSRLLAVGGSPVIRLCEGRFGITRREWRVLALLAQNEGLLSSQLAARAQLDRARTSRAVTTLVAKKLLQRETRPGDRRQAALALTDAGRDVFQQLLPLVVELNHQLLERLGAHDVALLDRVLDNLQQRADQMMASADLPKANRRRGGRTRGVMG